MKNIFSILVITVIVAALVCVPVRAQSQTTLISIHPITAEVRAALETWLATSAPVLAPFYAVTYVQQTGFDYFVSLVALNISTADEEWYFVEDGDAPTKVLWIGSVKVTVDGIIEPLFETASAHSKLAAPRRAGGGSYVLFPFDAGTFVIYGPRGVHGVGDYGTSGMVAVDLVSGDDLGGGAASPAVYASDAGTIDFVCDDDTTVAVRTHSGTTGDYFVYAHLLGNANLTMSHSFEQGELIGNVKYGDFDDDCGWAEQKANHYHNHWMFTPTSAAFQAEGCILNTGTQKWTCGTDVVGVGGQLQGGGGTGTGADDPGSTGSSGTSGSANRESSFWDYLLIGIVSIVDRGILKLMPEHTSPTVLLIGTLNVVRIFFRLVWTLTRFNLNLGPIMALLVIVIGSKLIFGAIWLVFAVLRTIKSIPGA